MFVVDIPFKLEYKADLDYDGDVKASTSIDSGKQQFEYKVDGSLKKLKSSFTYTNDELGGFLGFGFDYNIDASLMLNSAWMLALVLARTTTRYSRSGTSMYRYCYAHLR